MADNFKRLSRAHERYRRQTGGWDLRQKIPECNVRSGKKCCNGTELTKQLYCTVLMKKYTAAFPVFLCRAVVDLHEIFKSHRPYCHYVISLTHCAFRPISL